MNVIYLILGFILGWLLSPIGNKLLELILLLLEARKDKSYKRILELDKHAVLMEEFLTPPKEQYDYEVEYIDNFDDEE